MPLPRHLRSTPVHPRQERGQAKAQMQLKGNGQVSKPVLVDKVGPSPLRDRPGDSGEEGEQSTISHQFANRRLP
jgi:hypothetical protein